MYWNFSSCKSLVIFFYHILDFINCFIYNLNSQSSGCHKLRDTSFYYWIMNMNLIQMLIFVFRNSDKWKISIYIYIYLYLKLKWRKSRLWSVYVNSICVLRIVHRRLYSSMYFVLLYIAIKVSNLYNMCVNNLILYQHTQVSVNKSISH